MQHHPLTPRHRLVGAAVTALALLASLVVAPAASAEPPTSNTQWNVAGLADNIERLLLNENERREMGKAGRARVENYFDIRRQCAELEKIYAELI